MSNRVEALVLLHVESGRWLLTPKYLQQLQHKNDHCEYTDVQQEMNSFFQELVLVILLWELVSSFVFWDIQSQSLCQIEVVAEVVVFLL